MQIKSPRLRYLGVIGDVHAREDLLERAANALREANVDAIVCVGDVYGPGEGTELCCRLLKARQILTVRGNHDRWLLEAIERDNELRSSVGSEAVQFLSTLPATLSIETEAGPTLVCHGVGENDLAHIPQTFPRSFVQRALRVGLLPLHCKLVVHGHSHLQRRQICADVLFVTVGSLGSHPAGGCIVIDTQAGAVSPIRY